MRPRAADRRQRAALDRGDEGAAAHPRRRAPDVAARLRARAGPAPRRVRQRGLPRRHPRVQGKAQAGVQGEDDDTYAAMLALDRCSRVGRAACAEDARDVTRRSRRPPRSRRRRPRSIAAEGRLHRRRSPSSTAAGSRSRCCATISRARTRCRPRSARRATAVSFRIDTTELAAQTQAGRPQSGIRALPGVVGHRRRHRRCARKARWSAASACPARPAATATTLREGGHRRDQRRARARVTRVRCPCVNLAFP